MRPDEFSVLFSVSRETLERLKLYERLLREWGQTLSLVGRGTLDDIWHRHFADSAQIFHLIGTMTPVLDMGTGAGFPGMVLAMMGIRDMHLSDNNQKKVEFLHTVARETDTAVTIHNCKAEVVPDHGYKTITARALSPLTQLLAMARPLVRRDTQAVFFKGRAYNEEIAEARRGWAFDCIMSPSLTSPDSAILRITALTRQNAA